MLNLVVFRVSSRVQSVSVMTCHNAQFIAQVALYIYTRVG